MTQTTSAPVLEMPEFVRVTGDPNSPTCHICHGPPTALCVRCHAFICRTHSPSCCGTPRYVGSEAPAWSNEIRQRYLKWKGEA